MFVRAKIMSAFLSPFILGAILGATHFIMQPQSNWTVMLGIVLVFSFPVYLIIGLPVSVLIDRVLENSNQYLKRLLLFVGTGLLTGIVCIIVFPNLISSSHVMEGAWFGALLGALASAVFFHIQFFIETFSRRRTGAIASPK